MTTAPGTGQATTGARTGSAPAHDTTPRDAPLVGRGDVVVATVVLLVAAVLLLAASALAEMDPQAVPAPVGGRAWWVGVAAVVAQVVVLVWRRRYPGAVLVLVATAAPLEVVAGAESAAGATSVAIVVAAYTVAARGRWRWDGPAAALAVGLVAWGSWGGLDAEGAPVGALVGLAVGQGLATVGIGVVIGVVVGARRESAEARARQVEALSREHAARVEAAVDRERAEMARELHDIAAHHLSGIAVMAGAIGRQIDADPEAAKAGVERVRAETSAMLDELRSLVRLLRETPTPQAGSRVDSLSGLAALVDRAREAGVEASLTVQGTQDGAVPVGTVGPLAQLAVHRTVQEALANVVRHAPGARCRVEVDARDPACLVVSVRNGPPQGRRALHGRGPDAGVGAGADVGGDTDTGGGLGLVGMQERADLTDARLTYGPEPDGGWLVTLTVPAHAPTATDLSAPEGGTA